MREPLAECGSLGNPAIGDIEHHKYQSAQGSFTKDVRLEGESGGFEMKDTGGRGLGG